MIEVKKNVNDDLQYVEPKALIECIVYVQYAMCIEELKSVIGIVTDGATWHCLLFAKESDSINFTYRST